MNHSLSERPLSIAGLSRSNIQFQLDPQTLTQLALEANRGRLTSNGVLNVLTGKFTGRAPEDRFIVRDSLTEDRVWWGNVNIAFDKARYTSLKSRVLHYLDGKNLFVRDAFAGAEDSVRISIRVINEFPDHNLFCYNMFLRPTTDELAGLNPEWTILHAPGFEAEAERDGTRQGNFAILSFEDKTILIGGTGYTGEMKKGIFSALNFLLPTQHNTLPMHCSANMGKDGSTALFFGLSGTGKTTLSADPNRQLIGDDEHGWTAGGLVFNFEGGCYAKVIDLTEEKEPEIFRAIRPGALLENVLLDEQGMPDYSNKKITENTRASYPIDHIDNCVLPSQGPAPKHVFFLTADAYGILPPLSKLTRAQAAYHFMSGYTAKVAGTEAGVTEPKAAFSACFGAPFMPLHPSEYAEMLMCKLSSTDIQVWLVNTGWTGGAYGTGQRISLKNTRRLIQAAMSGELDGAPTVTDPYFGLARISECPGVLSELLDPRATWSDTEAYDAGAQRLASLFQANFTKFEEGTADEIKAAGPRSN
jgi:phosphoenolpyruvate carboxykinase (ATP)